MLVCRRLLFFFFKQKTAYEMRISDWSSDVCSSDLGSANDERAQANRAAAASAAEIVAIIRDSADQHVFTAADATAVMAALHAIRWTHVAAHPDRETLVLPLTRHDPRAPLWVHTYRALLFDHAKHAWCADPSRLSAPARACFAPLWQDLAAREMESMGPPSLSSVAGLETGRAQR